MADPPTYRPCNTAKQIVINFCKVSKSLNSLHFPHCCQFTHFPQLFPAVHLWRWHTCYARHQYRRRVHQELILHKNVLYWTQTNFQASINPLPNQTQKYTIHDNITMFSSLNTFIDNANRHQLWHHSQGDSNNRRWKKMAKWTHVGQCCHRYHHRYLYISSH